MSAGSTVDLPVTAPAPPLTAAGSVDLWHIPLAPWQAHRAALDELLSAEERARILPMPSTARRDSAIVAQGVLRLVLAAYLTTTPARLAIDRSAKPRLADGGGIVFNVAHAGEDMIVAVAEEGAAVGADIERPDPGRDATLLARQFFRPDEAAAVKQAGPDAEAVFLRLWTVKEAVMKADGAGMRIGLGAVDALPALDCPAWAEVQLGDSRYGVRSLVDIAGCIAAIAVAHGPRVLRRLAALPAADCAARLAAISRTRPEAAG